MLQSLFVVLLFASLSIPASAQLAEWKLTRDQDKIRVYERQKENSSFRELKIEMEVDAPISRVIEMANATSRFTDWVYKCTEARLVKPLDEQNQQVYYARVDVPWPLSDRDLLAEVTSEYDEETQTYTSVTRAVPMYEPEVVDVVRMNKHDCVTRYKSINNGQGTLLSYVLHSEPGGHIPSWASNMFLEKGPLTSMKEFRKLIEQ